MVLGDWHLRYHVQGFLGSLLTIGLQNQVHDTMLLHYSNILLHFHVEDLSSLLSLGHHYSIPFQSISLERTLRKEDPYSTLHPYAIRPKAGQRLHRFWKITEEPAKIPSVSDRLLPPSLLTCLYPLTVWLSKYGRYNKGFIDL